MKIIKRYKNRRLYDTDTNEFITHDDLKLIVRGAIPFQVVDSRSGRDITLAVLGRLLVRELKSWKDIKTSKAILINVINKGGKQSVSILRKTFLASVGIINLTRKKAEEIVDSLIKAGEISQSERKQAVMELLDRAEESTAKVTAKIRKESGGVQKEINKVLDRIKKTYEKVSPARIMSELEKLNKKVDKLSKAIQEKDKA
jgi:polyhydroxyalkanoate synthesis repressor PhaR